ncbi:phthiocerol/phenolphthiocerol synthesis type-I polyketide synthase C [Burkholderiales bacterium]|nr:phthiocerol/phenolphthiocerol synthesis type-I polyketide synthase C [Burkholderiales bacterium]
MNESSDMPATPAGTSPAAPIAVIGMSLRVPGATTLARFWRNLVEGRDCLSRPTAAALRLAGVSQEVLSHPDYVCAKPTLDDVEHFDAEFFDMSAREAGLTDPAHRLFLECAWECLESAGVVPGRSAPVTGVFGGYEGNYQQLVLDTNDEVRRDVGLSLPVRIGNSLDFLTTRVSHKLDLTGPSFGVMAACATSLMAVDLAVQSLRRGECEVALAGGSTILLPRVSGYIAGVEGMHSPSGRLRPFDAEADGTIFGSGAGVVALRPLADALAAGNPIHAIIRGSASSNDGNPPGKESFVAPSAEGQIIAIEAALRDAGVSPDTIGYVEAHGTGTRLGDPVEVAALTEVYRRHTGRTGFCSLGSVKGNVGHLRCGAGVASLIKACLALEHRTLPPLANFGRPNPRIDFAGSPFFVHADARRWDAGSAPRRAAVSSFGFGGSNVHVVLEEHRPEPSRPSSRGMPLLPVSARSQSALARRVGDLQAHLDGHPELLAADVAHTLQVGRRAFAHRACFLADGPTLASAGRTFRRPLASDVAPASGATPVFLFPGQGSQRRGAGRELYAAEPLFRGIVDECAESLAPALDVDIRALLGYGESRGADADNGEFLRRTANAQPALFVVGYATARLFMSWGVTPAAMLGHSLGELVAACLAGVFSLADGLKLVAARARLMQDCEPGSMAAVFLPEMQLAPRLPAALEIAAVNAPSISVVSGPTPAVADFCEALEREGVGTQRIETSHAFHSRMMEPALPAFARVLADITLSAPTIPVISNATGVPLTAAQATDPVYWSDHIRHPVRFSPGAEHLLALSHPAFVELGPGSALGDLIRRHDAQARVFAALPTTSRDGEGAAARAALGGLWCAGVDVDWRAAEAGERRDLVTLPTYPFQRIRHWRDGEASPPPDTRKMLYERGFREDPLSAEAPPDRARPRIVLGAEPGLAAALRDRLAADGVPVMTLVPGDAFERIDEHRFRIRPDAREDWSEVFARCMATSAGKVPHVVHLGSITGTAGPHNTAAAFDTASRAGFHSLVALTQAAHDQGICHGLDVLVVGDGIAKLDGEPGQRHAEKAALLGASRDIPLEIPGLRMRVVDVPSHDDAAVPGWLTDAVLGESGVQGAPALVCLRPGARHAEQLYAIPALAESAPRLREGGVVLITGGTGGLGLVFAGSLFDLCRARLALTARWTPPPEEAWPERAKRDDRIGRSLAAVLALRARGAEVFIVACDTADRAQVARALEATRARYGALHGVVHAAGALQPSPVIEKTREAAARVFGAKVMGAFHLDELVADEPLDCFVHVSSQASQFPEPGQVDYAAANAVLDALAQNRARRSPGLSCAIGWGPWQEVGLAADRLRHSLDAGAERAASRGRSARDVAFDHLDHPILKARAREQNGDIVYRGVLRRGHWLVDDHRLDGYPLLSGTTHVQLARTAFLDHSTGTGAVELTRVAFQRPLFTAEQGTEIELRFAASRDDERFTLRSRPLGTRDEWEEHSSGYARRTSATPRPLPPLPPRESWQGRPANPPFGNVHLSGGPRWKWRRQESEHDGRPWGRLVLPAEFVGDLDEFDVHPALMDGATAGGSRAIHEEAIPHTYDCIRFFAGLAPEVLAVAAHRAMGTSIATDITIADPDGNTLVEIEGYVMRPFAGSQLDQASHERRHARESEGTGPRQVVVGELGELDSLRVAAFTPREPGPGEVQIEVRAAGLNFRDVLSALGQMPHVADGMTPGGECSGVISAVGPGVRHLAVGDAVVAVARSSLGTHATTGAHSVVAMPANLDFNRAAGLPIVFLTAQYALETLARVAPGERVLIHAAAGGVGLAAIQIARLRGAEIHATAGHPDKRDYLRSLGVKHVYDSRSLAFVDEIRAATGGEGVDVVLNALAGEFIPASLGLLRSQGRFIEIGKRDLLAGTQLGLAPFLRNLSFTAFDLGTIVDARHPMLPAMFDALMDRFARGELVPIPTAVMPFERAEEGFRRMARAQHIGKIVFQVRADTSTRAAIARAFEERYGSGVPVEWGLDVFRRILSWSESPSYVLAMGTAAEGVGTTAMRSRVAGEGRGREHLATAYRAAETDVEKALAGLWEKTLGISPIGIDDDFIDLGGDSIEAIQIQHAIHRDFDLRIKNTEFLAEPTIAALARLIAKRHHGAPAATPATV